MDWSSQCRHLLARAGGSGIEEMIKSRNLAIWSDRVVASGLGGATATRMLATRGVKDKSWWRERTQWHVPNAKRAHGLASWTRVWLPWQDKSRYCIEDRPALPEDTTGLFFEEWPGKQELVLQGDPKTKHIPILIHETVKDLGRRLPLAVPNDWRLLNSKEEALAAGITETSVGKRTSNTRLRITNFKVFKRMALCTHKGVLDAEAKPFQIIYGGPQFMVDLVEDGSQVLFFRKKTQYIQLLDTIAANVTLTTCPCTEVLRRASQFIDTTVLKHEGSNNCRCRVYHSAEAVARVQPPVKENELALQPCVKDVNAGEGLFWFVQELVPPLRKYGEWRAYVLAGKVVSVIGTTPCEQMAAMNVFEAFVKQTLDALIVEVESRTGQPSFLRQFARVDVSFIAKADGEGYNYFVNEIEPGGNVSLFCGYSDQAEVVMGTLLTSLLERYEHSVEGPTTQFYHRTTILATSAGQAPRGSIEAPRPLLSESCQQRTAQTANATVASPPPVANPQSPALPPQGYLPEDPETQGHRTALKMLFEGLRKIWFF
ncbi:hypothetical protein C8R44DRAFT_731230 [Mycena epipterygia]|nr:hypothetical protein C8R44DRAFT_731230 [Mycena epipterygia]